MNGGSASQKLLGYSFGANFLPRKRASTCPWEEAWTGIATTRPGAAGRRTLVDTSYNGSAAPTARAAEPQPELPESPEAGQRRGRPGRPERGDLAGTSGIRQGAVELGLPAYAGEDS